MFGVSLMSLYSRWVRITASPQHCVSFEFPFVDPSAPSSLVDSCSVHMQLWTWTRPFRELLCRILGHLCGSAFSGPLLQKYPTYYSNLFPLLSKTSIFCLGFIFPHCSLESVLKQKPRSTQNPLHTLPFFARLQSCAFY